MNVSRTAIESVTVVRLDGNLDTNTSPEVQESLNKLINEGYLEGPGQLRRGRLRKQRRAPHPARDGEAAWRLRRRSTNL